MFARFFICPKHEKWHGKCKTIGWDRVFNKGNPRIHRYGFVDLPIYACSKAVHTYKKPDICINNRGLQQNIQLSVS